MMNALDGGDEDVDYSYVREPVATAGLAGRAMMEEGVESSSLYPRDDVAGSVGNDDADVERVGDVVDAASLWTKEEVIIFRFKTYSAN
jgi:hypothetical protein